LYGGCSSIGNLGIVQKSVTSDLQSKKSNSELRNVGAQIASADEVQDLRICCVRDALWKPRVIRRAFDDLVLFFENCETKRIISLALPFTLLEVVMYP
jgi:pyrimidine operon attenuation protein/uracil phosphoribosyltransferase